MYNNLLKYIFVFKPCILIIIMLVYLAMWFQDLITESRAMELDLDNEIEKTKREGKILNSDVL